MMGPYDPVEPQAWLIEKLEKRRKLVHAGVYTIADVMMVSKGITLLAQTSTFNKDIQEWRQQTTDLNALAIFKTFSKNLIENSGERSPPHKKGGTRRRYKIFMV